MSRCSMVFMHKGGVISMASRPGQNSELQFAVKETAH
jgi:hypothetical protein